MKSVDTKFDTNQRARYGVVGSIYHQLPNDEPVAVDECFGGTTESEEQSYVRSLVVHEDWQDLDYGWVDRPLLLYVENKEGKFSVYPTQEERQEVLQRVVEVGIGGVKMAVIRPGQSLRVDPDDVKLQARCRKGQAKVRIMLIPG